LSSERTPRASQRLDSHLDLACSAIYSITALVRIASIRSSQVRTDKLQPVIDAASLLRTLMKDARGSLIR
jgi:hypothetical protein